MQKKLFYLLFAALMIVSCGKPEDPSADNPNNGSNENKTALTVDPVTVTFPAAESLERTVTVTAVGVKWSVSVSELSKEWLACEVTDDSHFILRAQENIVPEGRNGIVTVESEDSSLEPVRINVSQLAAGESAIIVTPKTLTFAYNDTESQEVEVTTVGKGFSWSARPDNVGWIQLETKEDKIIVSVSKNTDLESSRTADILVIPSVDYVQTQLITVTQEVAQLERKFSVSPTDDIHFGYNESRMVFITVTAEDVEWSVRLSGENTSWVKLIENTSSVTVSAARNNSLEARECQLIIEPETDEFSTVVMNITQDAGVEHFSNLTEDVALDSSMNNMYYVLRPAQKWNTTGVSTQWDVQLYSQSLTRTSSGGFTGTGVRIRLNMFSDRINYNDNKQFFLTAGEYSVRKYLNTEYARVAFTVSAGRESSDMLYPSESWYIYYENGVPTEYGPIVEGSVTVTADASNTGGVDDKYQLVLDLFDDAGYAISGTCRVSVVDRRIQFFEEPEPPANKDDDFEDDPGFGVN